MKWWSDLEEELQDSLTTGRSPALLGGVPIVVSRGDVTTDCAE